MKNTFKIIIITLILFGTEKAIPKDLLENIEILRELEFFFFMDSIEYETKKISQQKNNKKESINSKTEILSSTISFSTSSITTDTIKNIKISTSTRRDYE